MYAKRGRQIALLIIVNLILLAMIPVILHFFNVINLAPYFQWVPFVGNEEEAVIEETPPQDILKEEQLDKQEERLMMWETRLQQQQEEILSRENELEIAMQELQDLRNELENKEQQFEQQQLDLQDRDVNIKAVVEILTNMNPTQAVSILQGLDDTDIVDIFREIDRQAAETGQRSMVPYFNMLMAGYVPPQQAEEASTEEGPSEELIQSRRVIRRMLRYPTEAAQEAENQEAEQIQQETEQTAIAEAQETRATTPLEELGISIEPQFPQPVMSSPQSEEDDE